MLRFSDVAEQPRALAAGEEVAEVASDMLSDRAYEALLDAILSLRLPPGEKLHIARLSARMKLSPTPIKHALMRLAGEGLVTTYPHRGFYVTRLSAEQIEDLYDLRLMCELHAAERVSSRAPNGFGARLVELEAGFERLVEEQADFRLMLLKDRDFHCFMVDQAGSPMLSRWYRGLNVHVEVIRLMARASQAEALRPAGGTVAGHRQIVQAFAEGDLPAARRAIADHIAYARARVLGALDAGGMSLVETQGTGPATP